MQKDRQWNIYHCQKTVNLRSSEERYTIKLFCWLSAVKILITILYDCHWGYSLVTTYNIIFNNMYQDIYTINRSTIEKHSVQWPK